MKHIFIKCRLLCLLAFMSISAFAQPISKEEAQLKAQQFFGKANQSRDGRGNAPRTAPLLTLVNNCDEFYIFNDEANGGYVIVSGDERMPDILGYSYDGHFDTENVPCNMEVLLEGYAEEVKYVKTHNIQKKEQNRVEAWEKDYIAPMLSTTWNQRKPVNNQCPTINGEHCVTGCVATAMAQILAYHQWPLKTTETIPQYKTSTYGIDVPAIETTSIDWENMLPSYNYSVSYTEKQADAVANLMKLCGASIQMDYGLDGSSGSFRAVESALVKYFGYSDHTKYVTRYTFSAYERLIYNELANRRPVCYTGSRSSDDYGGHAMVIDGFQGDGNNHFFHVNFGWGGSSDGFFLLSEVQYKYNSGAVVGISPLKPDSSQVYGVLEEEQLTLYYDNKQELRNGTIIFNHYLNKEITKCVIDSSFKEYTPYSLISFFEDCGSLREIVGLENMNTSYVTDMSYMFSGCSNLTSLDLSGFNTDNVTNVDGMFQGCESLMYIIVGDKWSTSKVSSGKDMFYNCYELIGGSGTPYGDNHIDYTYACIDGGIEKPGYFTSVGAPLPLRSYAVLNDDNTVLTFYCDDQRDTRNGIKIKPIQWTDNKSTISTVIFDPSFVNSLVSSTAEWFRDCNNLTNIIGIENLITNNVTDMSYMFSACSSLTSLDLSGFKTDKVTDMRCMFYGCSSLTSLDLSNFNTNKVTDMGDMFRGCSSLTSLDLSNFNTNKVTDMGDMFRGCSSLTNLDLSSFNTANVTDMGSMFSDCSSLTSLDVSGFNTANVTNMCGMFYRCSGLTALDVSGFNTENVTNMGDMFAGCSRLTALDVSGFNTANVTNMCGMFYRCSGLTALDVSGFNTENVTNMGDMFAGCSRLTALDVSGFNTENVISMRGMFESCSRLTALDVSGFKTEKVTTMWIMFCECSNLTTLDVSSFNTANVTDMRNMFNGCSGLTSLDVTHFNTEKVTSIWGMFSRCSRLTALDVSGFNTANVTNMDAMFSHCYRLTSLDVTHFNTEKVTGMWDMFSCCSGLTSLDLSGFNTASVTNMRGMFSRCSGLTTIYVGDGWSTEKVTELNNMFDGCTNLVGGRGTTYDTNHVDVSYAHIDGGPDNPGFLTYKDNSNAINTLLSKSSYTIIYDLYGNRHNSLVKGINIVDGKKVMVK